MPTGCTTRGPGRKLHFEAVTQAEIRIFLSAGETSGDHYGAEIITALNAAAPGLTFTGLGGLAMERAGLHRIVRAEDIAVMGITEILRHVPKIYRSYRRLVRSIVRQRPAAAVLIDFPDVNFRLAKHLRRLGVPVIWFVSPQLWAWKRRRLRWVKSRVDRMLVIFPFEERFYRARGVQAEFTGHPFVDARAGSPETAGSREEFAREHGLSADRQWIALLPGSRGRELLANLPEMLRAARLLEGRHAGRLEFVLPVASGLELSEVRTSIERLQSVPRLKIHLGTDAAAALRHARVAVVASGTATVLAAVVGTPFLVVYRVSGLTFALARRLIAYPPEIPAQRDEAGNLPVAMVNLIAGRRIVPELLNDRFTAEAVAAAVETLLEEGSARHAQLAGLNEVRSALRIRQDGAPVRATQRVAEAVLELLASARAR